ncbi:hypothetical protein [Alkalibacillus silvisoli]|uniref:Uncharacterized protein n=1 Tax=Alkalibacillus silvisoli TaxID=392823 RepID=A0ABN0ZUM9_9BACI
MDKQVEQQILSSLMQIQGTLDEHSNILNEHSKILNEHSEILKEHSKLLKEHSNILESHDAKLQSHSDMLKEHGRMLSSLRTGQEELKAEIDGMKLENAKEFGEIKSRISIVEAQNDALKDETWQNKIEIYRFKKLFGF